MVSGKVDLPLGVTNSKNLSLEVQIGVTVKPAGNSNNNASQPTGGGSRHKNSDTKKKDDSKQSNDGKNTTVSSEMSTNGNTDGNTEEYKDTQTALAKDAISFVTERNYLVVQEKVSSVQYVDDKGNVSHRIWQTMVQWEQ